MHIRKLTTHLPQSVRFNIRKMIFSGRGRHCALCLNEVRSFHPHGGGADVLDRRKVVGGMRRLNDRCPVCHAQDRARMIMMFLKNDIGVGRKPLKILHIAPEYSLFLWLMRQPNVAYVGTDLDGSRYRHIKNFTEADITALPFDENAFDVVICSHVLEHVPDDKKAMSEICRVLKPGGHALLLAPMALDGQGTDEDPSVQDPIVRNGRFGQWDHVRLYDPADFIDRMRSAGFETQLFEPFETNPEQAAELRLNPIEKLPVGTKAQPL